MNDEKKSERHYNSRSNSKLRSNNVITLAGGTAIMNGDLPDPLFEIYFHVGYKRFLGSHVNINFTYHKFNLAYKDLYNNGFMSFDLNLEVILLPKKSVTPYIYVGGGLNAANYFKQTDPKVQGGGGFEYLLTQSVGIKLFADYNYIFSDLVDGLEFGDANDVIWRLGFGLNFYFGKHGKSKRISRDEPTVISSNPIE